MCNPAQRPGVRAGAKQIEMAWDCLEIKHSASRQAGRPALVLSHSGGRDISVSLD